MTIQNRISAKLMPKNIFVDLNVILDVFLARQGFEASQDIIQLGEQTDYQLWVSAHLVTTLAYLLEASKVPRSKISEHIEWLLDTFGVVTTDEQLLRAATLGPITDYEDSVVEQAAIKAGAEVIITRNIRDFRNSTIKAQTPKQYLA